MRRMAAAWSEDAVKAAQSRGAPGVRTLETFGEDAAKYLNHDPAAFASLVRVSHLDRERFRLAAGPWKQAVLDWAGSNRLPRFLDRLRALPADRLTQAVALPSALPFLCVDQAPAAHRMIRDHGSRAVHFFLAVDCAAHPEDLERLAQAVDADDRILDIHEQYGFAFALLLVAPATAKGSRDLPRVSEYTLRRLDRPLALALLMTNYTSLRERMDAGMSAREVEKAIDLLRNQSDLIQELAAGHPHVLRLLSERWNEEEVGLEVVRRCGPSAADLVYGHYASDDRLKWPALLALAKLGTPGFRVLHKYRNDDRIYKLLRRADGELMDRNDRPPLVVDAIGCIDEQSERLDSYLQVANLPGQLRRERYPVPPDPVLDLVPGYTTYRVISDAAQGLRVSGDDIFWSCLDTAEAGLMIVSLGTSGIAVKGGEMVALQTGKAAAKKAGKKVLTQIGNKAVTKAEHALAERLLQKVREKAEQSWGQWIQDVIRRAGREFVERFGKEAEEILRKRVEARVAGFIFENLDRSREYAALEERGDREALERLVEDLAQAAAEQYARSAGYALVGTIRARGKVPGLGQIYRDGSRVKVLVPKASGARLRRYGKYLENTLEYVREVASVVKEAAENAEDRRAAAEVLAAQRENRADVEVVRIAHDRGRPGPTRVEEEDGEGRKLYEGVALESAGRLDEVPGARVAWMRQSAGRDQGIGLRDLVRRAQEMAGKLGLHLWTPGAAPLDPRDVHRDGGGAVRPDTLPVADEARHVGELIQALMDRLL